NIREVDQAALTSLFHEIDIDKTSFYFRNIKEPLQFFDALTSFINTTGAQHSSFSGSMGMDPIGDLVKTGEFDPSTYDAIAGMIQTASKLFPQFRIITIDAGFFQDGGSTLSQELGYGLAMANTCLDELTRRGLEPGTIASMISVSFATGPDYFLEIAKPRAARHLWNVLISEWGVDAPPSMHIQSRSAAWNLALYDVNVNMLRTTTGAMSASLGGSDVISVLPFDYWSREPNDFSARIARNTQIVLREEAWFGKVADPAAGSYYIEKLTEQLAEQAWHHFMEAEEKGGFTEAFRQGIIQDAVAASREYKRARAASRRDTILGVNQYPAFSEVLLSQDILLPEDPEEKQATFRPIRPFRIAGEIEKLRLQTEKRAKRPKVFLLKYGEPAWRSARAMFAGNFFACAGYEIIDNLGYDQVEKGIADAKKTDADIVVLCSADAAYGETAPVAFDALHENAEIVIAGYPQDDVAALAEKGISHFIHVKSNLLDELRKFQELLNINE
ncbi:MAG: methylmalonyl-CoA mutase family protein, partial [Bacteroidales bacterium]|nr:methylmalonyl-CoA mutase family protein [Bacteroidales bacterium]